MGHGWCIWDMNSNEERRRHEEQPKQRQHLKDVDLCFLVLNHSTTEVQSCRNKRTRGWVQSGNLCDSDQVRCERKEVEHD